jgi:hypothetical protein
VEGPTFPSTGARCAAQDLGEDLGGRHAASHVVGMVSVRRDNGIFSTQQGEDRRTGRLLSDVHVEVPRELVGYLADRLLGSPHEEHGLEQRPHLLAWNRHSVTVRARRGGRERNLDR